MAPAMNGSSSDMKLPANRNGLIRNGTVSKIIILATRTGIQVNSSYSPVPEGVAIDNVLFSDNPDGCAAVSGNMQRRPRGA